MAATDSSPHEAAQADDLPESGVGMDHPTAVPTNFDPTANGCRRD
ncbi:hypothetical protein [Natrarchaeobaculum aegyptiacum]|nr:hypothetical protein [Natrarchaeobaculum aegyptiacum]